MLYAQGKDGIQAYCMRKVIFEVLIPTAVAVVFNAFGYSGQGSTLSWLGLIKDLKNGSWCPFAKYSAIKEKNKRIIKAIQGKD